MADKKKPYINPPHVDAKHGNENRGSFDTREAAHQYLLDCANHDAAVKLLKDLCETMTVDDLLATLGYAQALYVAQACEDEHEACTKMSTLGSFAHMVMHGIKACEEENEE